MGDTTCSFQLNLNSDFQNTYLTEETKASYPLAFFMCTCSSSLFRLVKQIQPLRLEL